MQNDPTQANPVPGSSEAQGEAPVPTTAVGPRELSPGEATEYDFMLVLDRSGSMARSSHRFPDKSLWEEAEEFTIGLAGFASKVDDDGITVITFSSDVHVHDGVDTAKVQEIFSKEHPGGGTNLLGALQAVEHKFKSANKKAIVTVVTDGAPNPGQHTAVADLIVRLANGLTTDKDLSFGFVQMGRDQEAAAFLDYLDDDLEARGAKYDIVDAVKAEVAETLNIPQLLAKFMDD